MLGQRSHSQSTAERSASAMQTTLGQIASDVQALKAAAGEGTPAPAVPAEPPAPAVLSPRSAPAAPPEAPPEATAFASPPQPSGLPAAVASVAGGGKVPRVAPASYGPPASAPSALAEQPAPPAARPPVRPTPPPVGLPASPAPAQRPEPPPPSAGRGPVRGEAVSQPSPPPGPEARAAQPASTAPAPAAERVQSAPATPLVPAEAALPGRPVRQYGSPWAACPPAAQPCHDSGAPAGLPAVPNLEPELGQLARALAGQHAAHVQALQTIIEMVRQQQRAIAALDQQVQQMAARARQ